MLGSHKRTTSGYMRHIFTIPSVSGGSLTPNFWSKTRYAMPDISEPIYSITWQCWCVHIARQDRSSGCSTSSWAFLRYMPILSLMRPKSGRNYAKCPVVWLIYTLDTCRKSLLQTESKSDAWIAQAHYFWVRAHYFWCYVFFFKYNYFICRSDERIIFILICWFRIRTK
jgi:hypothetical protein